MPAGSPDCASLSMDRDAESDDLVDFLRELRDRDAGWRRRIGDLLLGQNGDPPVTGPQPSDWVSIASR